MMSQRKINKLVTIGFILLFFWGYGCVSEAGRNIHKLVEELDIPLSRYVDSCRIVVIPGNGCNSCIRGALDHMRNSDDTLYVFVCRSEKEFFLQKGEKASSFRNLYLDKENHSFRLAMLTTYPMVYLMKHGKYVSHEPYQSGKSERQIKPLTVVSIEQQVLDLGQINMEQTPKNRIGLRNIGSDTLFVHDLRSSCECTEVEWGNSSIAPHQTSEFYVIFHPETLGYFEREIEILCNVKESPVRILIKGTVVDSDCGTEGSLLEKYE